MLAQGKFPVVRVASYSMRHVKDHSKNGKVSGKSIKDALKANPNMEFIDALTGQATTTKLAKECGAVELHVKYNADRDTVVIKL